MSKSNSCVQIIHQTRLNHVLFYRPYNMTARVLLVDDDEDILDMMSQILSRKGLSIIGTAKNGLESYHLYMKLQPDIVLMDIVMPEYDGEYGLQKILQFDPYAKVIVVTGCVSDLRDKLKNTGAVGVLSKPCEIDLITNLIRKIMNEKQITA